MRPAVPSHPARTVVDHHGDVRVLETSSGNTFVLSLPSALTG